jgi:hypothetical protein
MTVVDAGLQSVWTCAHNPIGSSRSVTMTAEQIKASLRTIVLLFGKVAILLFMIKMVGEHEFTHFAERIEQLNWEYEA